MKGVNLKFEDKEFLELIKIKNGSNWHDFIIEGAKLIEEKRKNGS